MHCSVRCALRPVGRVLFLPQQWLLASAEAGGRAPPRQVTSHTDLLGAAAELSRGQRVPSARADDFSWRIGMRHRISAFMISALLFLALWGIAQPARADEWHKRSEEHTSELQSLAY